MMVNVRCKICKKEGFFDIGDLTKEEALMVLPTRKSTTCLFGGHKENIPPTELFEFLWENESVGNVSEESEESTEEFWSKDDQQEVFISTIEKLYGKAYTHEELCEKFNIESNAFGGCLCSSIENEDLLILFQQAVSPKGEAYYYSSNGGVLTNV